MALDISKYGYRIINKKILNERNGEYSQIPNSMLPELKEYLKEIGIEKLYSHQGEMFEKALERKNLVITTSTASGKTFSFLLPVLQDILMNPSSRAIFIYPTKALASDQFRTIQSIANYFGEDRLQVGVYDGDTPPNERSKIRNNANIILTNPDMLNSAFLPNHSKYGFDFIFSNLKYIIVDEMHMYRGAFGAHFANVLKRVKRMCNYYNSSPQFLASSATIANPIELAENLCGENFQVVSKDGAPSSKKNIYIWQPPLIKKTETRVSIVKEAVKLLPDLVASNSTFISFCKSRKAVEVILKEVRDRLKSENNIFDFSNLVSGYRGGYKAEERKEIESKMINGELKGLIATNALELGIDIGSVDTVVVTGFPGTKASFWQQAGRAGRQKKESNIFLILDDKPLDQYIAINSEWLFSSGIENAIVDRNNLYIQIAHIRAAAAELPLTLDDISLFPQLGEVIPVLMQAKELLNSSGKFIWIGAGFPAGDYSLRNIDNNRYKVINIENGNVITEMDEIQTYTELYKGAIYMHEGAQYNVLEQNIQEKTVKVKQVDLNHYTEVFKGTALTKIMEQKENPCGRTKVFLGDVNVDVIISAFRCVQFHNHAPLEWQNLEEPLSKDFDTEGIWYAIPEAVFEFYNKFRPLQIEGLNSRKIYWTYFDAMKFTLLNSSFRRTMSSKEDIGAGVMGIDLEGERKYAICLYDLYPGGLGFSNKAYEVAEEIIKDSIEMIKGCSCKNGCAACIGDYSLDKNVVIWGLENLLTETKPPTDVKILENKGDFFEEKQYRLQELDSKWVEFKEFIQTTGEYLTKFLSEINKVKIDGNKLILTVENDFYKNWLEEKNNMKQLINIISEYVEVASDFKIEVECQCNDEAQSISKITKRYENLRK